MFSLLTRSSLDLIAPLFTHPYLMSHVQLCADGKDRLQRHSLPQLVARVVSHSLLLCAGSKMPAASNAVRYGAASPVHLLSVPRHWSPGHQQCLPDIFCKLECPCVRGPCVHSWGSLWGVHVYMVIWACYTNIIYCLVLILSIFVNNCLMYYFHRIQFLLQCIALRDQ